MRHTDRTLRRDVALSDPAMMEYARTLAQTQNPDSMARLDVGAIRPERLRKLFEEAQTLLGDEGVRVPAMEWFVDNAFFVESSMRTLLMERSEKLPAVGGLPRVQRLMRELVAHGDAQVDADRLVSALRTFDEVQPLRMAELWAAPQALRAELFGAFLWVSEQVLMAQRDRAAAEEWIQLGAKRDMLTRSPRSSTFFEHALQMMHEQETPKARRMLEEWLERHEVGADAAIQLAHAEQAFFKLWLGNIMDSIRRLSALDWLGCFEQLSRTDRELRLEPSGVYPRMDDESRSVLRNELAHIARAADLSEITVARQAVKCAAAAQEGVRACVCWWLYDDKGRAQLLSALDAEDAPIRKLTPDPRGFKYMTWIALFALAFLLLFLEGKQNLLVTLCTLPLCIHYAASLIDHVCARLVRPHMLLKLQFGTVPDDSRTLMVIPALLSSPERAREALEQLFALGHQQHDENIDLLLLGDYRDGPNREEPTDAQILSLVRAEVTRMNERFGREKVFFLHRERVFCETQGQYMGHERKRGALMALNRLLLQGESSFDAEGARAEALHQRGYRYVISLDAGTWMLPGTAHKLIGAMAHPLNAPCEEGGRRRGYALLQPHMEQATGARLNRFARLMAGLGGVNSYPACVSSVYQDLCGVGIFGGKGIYDLSAFSGALEGRLPDGAILSHDLLEGLVCGAGSLCDVALFDAFPATPQGFFSRMNRWTRGDWQLIPFMGKALGLGLFERYLMLDNLRRSLTPVSALLLILLGLWLGNPGAVLIGLIFPFVPALLALPKVRKQDWASCGLRLSLLPVEVYQLLDAILRTLHRLLVSKKNLLSWVAAADAERAKSGQLLKLPGRIAALLMLPALLTPAWVLAALGLGMLFLTPELQIRDGAEDVPHQFSEDERALLMELARETWRFFESQVPDSGNGLPPDNLQLSPPVGAAKRTSPTNIGLYMAGCLAAQRLGIIDTDEMVRRMERTVGTLEALGKWRGQLYNWYDIETLLPLTPRYVSAVDGGNLAACLMVCASALRMDGGQDALSGRMDALCRDMEFEALFDAERKLFVIGADIERDRLSGAHYDLLASESRILSFVAMALGKAPARHWARLGRALTPGRECALLSWSGTMFEYLMPELLLPAPPQSLLGATNLAVVRAQQRRATGDIWGISESGYNAFDLQMNYQYRAFGLPELSLRGEAYEPVIAPYASALALAIRPKEAVANIRRLREMGFGGAFGLYEAIDCAPSRLREGHKHHVIKSYMAHHQGMILCALLNALRDNELPRCFMARPELRALSLLLCEKRPECSRIWRRSIEASRMKHRRPAPQRVARRGDPNANVADTHLLYGGGGTCLTSADGRSFYRVNGVMANRWQLGTQDEDGLFVHVRLVGRRLSFLANGGRETDKRLTRRVSFEEGSACWISRADDLEFRMTQCVSPEDGALVQQLVMVNKSEKPAKIELTGCFPVALLAQVDMQAHPAFHNLFVESALASCGNALVFRRRNRDDKQCPLLMHTLFGVKGESVSYESDLSLLVGREGSLFRPGGIAQKLGGSTGRVLNPCSALRVRLVLEPGERREVGFAIGIAPDDEAVKKLIKRYATPDAARRALMLSQTQARAMLDFLGMSAQRHSLLMRASAFLMWPKLRFLQGEAPMASSVSGLWALGISGDLPIIAAFISGKEQLELARDAMRAHEFYRAMGVWCDLVLVNEYGNNYEQPVRDALRDMTVTGHLRELIGEAGGVFLLEGAALSDAQRALIRSVCAIGLIGGEGSLNAQLLRRLNQQDERGEQPKPFPPDEPRPDEPAPLGGNGWGEFTHDGAYAMRIAPGRPTPAPWSNLICNPGFGTLVTERGGGFTWHLNSRSGRLTPFQNDPLQEGFSERMVLLEEGRRLPLLPGAGEARTTFRVSHSPGLTRFEARSNGFSWQIDVFVDAEQPIKCMVLTLKNESDRRREVVLCAQVDWLMGVGGDDVRLTRHSAEGSVQLARGTMPGVGFMQMSNEGGVIEAGGTLSGELLIGWAEDALSARATLARFAQQGGAAAALSRALGLWERRLSRMQVRVPDRLMSLMASRWLPYQALSARIFGRAGLYQPGGAYGFRDQLQDMLCLIPIEPERVRAHLLTCAARQFEQGDVMHWWHPERTGVRTRISDDLLFLPYVAAQYVKETGDIGVLSEQVPYLCAEELGEGQHDCYQTPPLSEYTESLHQHCMRAIERACRFGSHGLPLMGTGDWNDGMDKVGAEGRGESVWLAEFLAVVAREYAGFCQNDQQREELLALSSGMKRAVEEGAWDGQWYRRAYYDNGLPMGSAHQPAGSGCRIDAIAQCWAVAAGLREDRVKLAMDQVWEQLVDEEHGLIRLLTPAFDEPKTVPGYIMGYPPGVRENGGQYTHGACWVVMAYALLGQAERAWAAYEMLMPYSHAATAADAARYRVEPYVMAADVYSEGDYAGRGGWSWYTGAAAWMVRVMTRYLLGYERRGERAHMSALLPQKWDEASVMVQVGNSRYTLISRKGVRRVLLDGAGIEAGDILLKDDGRNHTALFPARAASDTLQTPP